MRQVYVAIVGTTLLAAGLAAEAQTPTAPTSAPPVTVPQDQAKLPPTAQTLINEALKTAKASHKPVLVYFLPDVLEGWGKGLDDFLHSADFGTLLADHYVLVRLVYPLYNLTSRDSAVAVKPNPGADLKLVQFENAKGADTLGPPIVTVVDSAQAVVGTAHRMPFHDTLILIPQEVDDLLVQTAPRMAATDRKRITDYLTEQAKIQKP